MKNCLIVDDVEVSRYVSRLFIEELGFGIVESFDKESCRNAIRDSSIDIVLLDWHLKKESGLDLISLIREETGGKNIPIIVFSGVESESRAQEAIDAGADGFIAKPTTKEKIETEFKKVGMI